MIPICNICDNNEKTIAYDPVHNLYQCVRCDHTFTLINEKYKEKDIYNEAYYQSNWFKNPNYSLFQYIHQRIIDQTKKHNFKLLDIGSGNGDFLSYLRKIEPASDLHGIDGAPCSSQDFKFTHGDFMNVWINDKFDVITSLACIEHVENPDKFVRIIKNIIIPEGLIVIMTINAGGMMYKLAKILKTIGIDSGYNRLYRDHHIHHFTNQSLKLLLEKHGFRIMSQKNHNYDLASVDYPHASHFITFLYKILTAIIFFLSSIFNNGISQTVVCVPPKNNV